MAEGVISEFFREKNVDPAELLHMTIAAGDDDQPIIDYVKNCAGM